MDGVIRHWRYEGAAEGERRAGLPHGVIGRIAFALPEYAASQVGAVTHAEWAAAIGRELVAAYGQEAAAAVEPWFAYRGELDAEMVALVERLRRRVPVAVVSNATDSLRSDLATFGLADLFTAVVCSAEVRLTKPDPAIYRLAARTVGVPPGACFFTDDLAVNVEGARAAGLHAEVFTGAAALRAQLVELGVLPTDG